MIFYKKSTLFFILFLVFYLKHTYAAHLVPKLPLAALTNQSCNDGYIPQRKQTIVPLMQKEIELLQNHAREQNRNIRLLVSLIEQLENRVCNLERVLMLKKTH